MRKKILLLFCLSIGSLVFAQATYSIPSDDFIKFHNSVSAAERMYKRDSLLQAYAMYDIAFENYKGAINPSHYFKATLCALKIKEEYKALHFLEKALTGGYEIDSAKVDDIVFYNQNTKKEYAANGANWKLSGMSGRNYEWEGELYKTLETNKKYSGTAYKAAEDYCTACLKNPKCAKNTPDYISKARMLKEKMKADSIVAEALLAKIRTNGFPNLKLVDKRACEIARNILLNYDADKKNDKLNPVLFKALNNGQISPAFYASVVDRRNLMNGVAPEFYEPLMGYEKTPAKELAPANEKRKKIGLYTIIPPNPLALKGVDTKNAKAYKAVFINLYDY